MQRTTLALVILVIALLALAFTMFQGKATDKVGAPPTQAATGRGEATEAQLEAPVGARKALSAPSVSAAQPSTSATLVALAMWAPDRLEPYSGTLLLHSPSGAELLRATADEAGKLHIPAGTWLVEAEHDGLHVDPRVVRVSAGETRTLFVSPRQTLKLQVLSTTGLPVEGARVKWTGRGTLNRLVPGPQRNPDRLGHSGPDGWVTLDNDTPLDELLGQLRVVADGYEPGVFLIDLSRSEANPSCTLRPSPEGATSVGTLTFIARASGEPVPGVQLSALAGELPGTSDASGRLELPSWLAGKDYLEVHHPRFGASDLKLADVLEQGGQVQLDREIDVVIDPGTKQPGILVVLAQTEGATEPDQRPELLNSSPYAKGERPSVRLAVGSTVLAIAIAKDGSVRRNTWQVQASRKAVTLGWSPEQYLELVLRETSGAPVASAKVQIGHEDWGTFTVVTDGAGLARIPNPDRVYDIQATRGNTALVSLSNVYHRPGEEAPAAGQLELFVDELGSVSIRLQDLAGKPLAGLELSLWEQGIDERFRLNPELDGDRPTSHPAWSRSVPPAPWGVTDLEGTAHLRNVLAGSFNIDIELASARDPDRSPFSITKYDIAIGPPRGERVLTIPAPVFAQLRAYDAATGLAITPLSLQSMSRVGGPNPNVKSSSWLGWLNPEEGPFRATVPGYEALELSSDELKGAPGRDLFLWPSGGAMLELEAAPELLESLEGQRLEIEALRPLSPELPWFKRAIWSGEAVIRDGQAHLPLAFEGHYTLKPIELNGRLLPIEPADFTWRGEPRILAHL